MECEAMDSCTWRGRCIGAVPSTRQCVRGCGCDVRRGVPGVLIVTALALGSGGKGVDRVQGAEVVPAVL